LQDKLSHEGLLHEARTTLGLQYFDSKIVITPS